LVLDGADTPHAISANARKLSIGGPQGTGSGGSDLAFTVGKIQWAYWHPGSLTAAQHLAMANGVSPLNFLKAGTSDFYAMQERVNLVRNLTAGPSGVGIVGGNAAWFRNIQGAAADLIAA
jgi:hypothetical protein